MSDGIPFGGNAPQFPGGLLPEQIAALLQLRDAQAAQQAQTAPQAAMPGPQVSAGPVSPDALLFNRGTMGGGANPFVAQGQDGPTTTGATQDPNVPVAMTEADVRQMERGMMPRAQAPAPQAPQVSGMNPDRTNAPGMPGVPAQPSVTAASTGNPNASIQPVNSFDPLTGQPVSGNPKPMLAPGEGGPTEGAGRVAAAAGNPAAAGQGASMMERFAKGLNNPEFGNLLFNLGIGIASNRGIGPGIAAGLQGYQTSQLAGTKQALEQFKLQQQIQGQQAQRGYLIKKGYAPEAADAMIANGTLLTDALGKDKPNYQTIGGNVYDLNKNGGVPGQGNLVGPSSGPPSGFMPTQDGGLAPIKGGPESVDYKKQVAEATASEKFIQVEQADGSKKPYLVTQDENGQTILQKPKGLPTEGSGGNPFAGTGKQNGDQAKAAGFSDRMFGSEPVLRKFENLNDSGIQATIAEHLPNGLKSTERQQMEQAQRDFINAQLRRESGAAISPEEFNNARQQYFPQPGDKPEVIAQKRVNRQSVITAMAREGGQGYQPPAIFGQNGEIVPFGPRAQQQAQSAPSSAQSQTPFSREDMIAEAKRRGLLK